MGIIGFLIGYKFNFTIMNKQLLNFLAWFLLTIGVVNGIYLYESLFLNPYQENFPYLYLINTLVGVGIGVYLIILLKKKKP